MALKSTAQKLTLFFKGFAMGAADVVPGVSGGTIAFITGIYEELVATIHQFNFSFFKIWRKEGFLKAWSQYNLSFLLVLVSGILTSVLSLAKLITYLLEHHPILMYAFIFGLVLSSVYFVAKQIGKWRISTVVILLLFVAVGYFITTLNPVQAPDSTFYLFLSGAIGIIAMILPGISGSFILLLLGSYQAILGILSDLSSSITTANWSLLSTSLLKLATVVLGMIVGLKLFSRLLTWLFKNYRDITLSVLTGLMVGAMNKIWPWKETVTTYINSSGEAVPLLEKSISPLNFDGNPQIFWSVILGVIGFLSIFLIEQLAARKPTEK